VVTYVTDAMRSSRLAAIPKILRPMGRVMLSCSEPSSNFTMFSSHNMLWSDAMNRCGSVLNVLLKSITVSYFGKYLSNVIPRSSTCTPAKTLSANLKDDDSTLLIMTQKNRKLWQIPVFLCHIIC